MKHSLSSQGLSLSQAQSISNLCNQRAKEIDAVLDTVNNYSRSITIEGKTYIETPAKPLPKNTADLLLDKALLHSCQAFLMENIKAKDQLLKEVKEKQMPVGSNYPERPELREMPELELVSEKWGWEQLSASEYNEYLESEAYASHIGQFIHRGGTLDKLRSSLPHIKTLEFFEVEKDKRTPMEVTVHHSSDQLLGLHEYLAGLHRTHEQRVNYFKAKVKNLVTIENARRSKEHAILCNEIRVESERLMDEYRNLSMKWQDEQTIAKSNFEEARQKEIESIAAMRIAVDARFQKVIDFFLPKVS